VVQSYSGIDVLLSPQNPVEGAQEMGDTRPILDFSRRLYDNVVIDLGNAYGEWALSAVRASDQVFLVTTNELPALQAAQRVMSYYENHGIARQGIHLIINRFNRDVGLTKEMIETALQTEIYQIVASDYEGVQRALLDGKPIQVSTSIGKQIQQIAERILGVDLEKQKKKTWRDELDERMMRLKYSDESMIHFKKSNNYLNIHKVNFKNNDDDVNDTNTTDTTDTTDNTPTRPTSRFNIFSKFRSKTKYEHKEKKIILSFDDKHFPEVNCLYFHLYNGQYYNDTIYIKRKVEKE
jgi:hypothetical protein